MEFYLLSNLLTNTEIILFSFEIRGKLIHLSLE